MRDEVKPLGKWQIGQNDVRRRVYQAPTAKEPDRWAAVRQLSQRGTSQAGAEALGPDRPTIGAWLTAFEKFSPRDLAIQQTGGRQYPDALKSTSSGMPTTTRGWPPTPEF